MLNLFYLLCYSIKGLSINLIPCKPWKEKCCNETLSYLLYFNVTYIHHNFQKVCRTCYVISKKNIHFVLDRVGIIGIITFLSYTDRYIVWMPRKNKSFSSHENVDYIYRRSINRYIGLSKVAIVVLPVDHQCFYFNILSSYLIFNNQP